MVNGASCLKRESGWPHQHENAQARVPQPAFPPARRRLLACSASARWSKQRGLGKGPGWARYQWRIGSRGRRAGSGPGGRGGAGGEGGVGGGGGEGAWGVGGGEVPAGRAADCP